MDVMMNMTTDDVRVLREHFTGHMSLEQFVGTLKKTLHDRIHSELDFVVGVVELFHTIDVNGDEFLDWDEFAGYMMDAGQAKADFYFDDLLLRTKRYQHLPLPLRDDKTPLNSVRTCIQQMLHLPEQHALAYFERDSDVVYLYALHFDRNDAPRHLATMRLHTAFQEHTVICIEYVAPKKLLVVSSMLHVGYISAWTIADLHSPAMVHRVESRAPHEHLCYVPALQCLLSSAVVFPAIAAKSSSSSNRNGSRTDGYRPHATTHVTKLNQLLRWDVSCGANRTGSALVPTELALQDRLKGVSSLATYKCINRTHIAIGCEDGVITVIDAESAETVSSFDAHGNGVKMLRFSPQVECLASIGFHSYSDETTLHVAIWRKRGADGRLAFETSLKHHDAPLELLAFVDSRRQLLSLDVSGVCLVYSSVLLTPTSEAWEVLQRFHITASPGSRIQSLFVVPETQTSDAVLVTAGRTVAFYDHCEVKTREEVFYCHHCQSLSLLVGVTVSKLLFWHADSGKLWKTFTYAAILTSSSSTLDAASATSSSSSSSSRGTSKRSRSSEYAPSTETPPRTITAACMDDRERKVIVGDDSGSLKVINAVNGNVMKELDPHTQAIASVSYVLHSKRVLSISIDSRLHIYDENNALGYYVPFGAPQPQSVLLQSLRFLPEVSLVSAAPAAPQPLQQQTRQYMRRRTHRHSMDLSSDISNLAGSSAAQPERFEIVKSVGNQALNKVAVLVAGSRGESFIQVWSFDMSHAQGTCIAPLDDELTCLSFVGSTPNILGGTASGRVFLWRAVRDDPGYHCTLELQRAHEEAVNSETRVASIQHIFAVDAAHVPLEPRSSAHVSEGDNNDNNSQDTDASSTFPLTDVPKHQPQQQHEPMHSQRADHSAQASGDGVYVFAGDDLGVVTAWVIRHVDLSALHQSPLHHHHHHPGLAVGADAALGSVASENASSNHVTTIGAQQATDSTVLQHEEMVLGYDAVAALYTRVFDQERRARSAAAVTPVASGNIVAKQRALKRPSPLAPTRRWEAHTGPVLCLSHALDPPVLLTSSTRGRIKVWSFYGEPLGVLDDFASRRKPVAQPWTFPLDMDERRRRKELEAQQFLEKSKGMFRRGKQPRMSVMQERLSLTHEELTFDYSSEKKKVAAQRHRHARLAIRTSDVGRAIRKFILAQAAPAPASTPANRGVSSASSTSSRSLQVVLKEIDQLQLQTSARSGSAGLSARRDAIGGSSSSGLASPAPKPKKQYARMTLADVKPLLTLRPRTSSAVHCELPRLPQTGTPNGSSRSSQHTASSDILTAATRSKQTLSAGLLSRVKRPKEIVFASASLLRNGAASSYPLQVAPSADAHLTLDDLRDEAQPPLASAASSNQDASEAGRRKALKPAASRAKSSSSSSDGVLKYHVKLAHSWQQYHVR